MSESGHFTSREVLTDRARRKIEAAYYVSKDYLLPYEKILGWVSAQPKTLNEGNSVRQLKIYLKELALAGYLAYDGDYCRLTPEGERWLSERLSKLSGWLKPIDFIKEQFDRLKRT